MKPITGKDFAKVLERHGWQLLRIHDNHHIYGKSQKKLNVNLHLYTEKPLIKFSNNDTIFSRH
jgi:predicted RNA binding protein YcfA (HicA-like mRNA interferase family)